MRNPFRRKTKVIPAAIPLLSEAQEIREIKKFVSEQTKKPASKPKRPHKKIKLKDIPIGQYLKLVIEWRKDRIVKTSPLICYTRNPLKVIKRLNQNGISKAYYNGARVTL